MRGKLGKHGTSRRQRAARPPAAFEHGLSGAELHELMGIAWDDANPVLALLARLTVALSGSGARVDGLDHAGLRVTFRERTYLVQIRTSA